MPSNATPQAKYDIANQPMAYFTVVYSYSSSNCLNVYEDFVWFFILYFLR